MNTNPNKNRACTRELQKGLAVPAPHVTLVVLLLVQSLVIRHEWGKDRIVISLFWFK